MCCATGVYRLAERAGRSRAIEWALTSEQVPATVMEQYGVVNRVVEDQALIEEATAFAKRLAKGRTRAHAAHKTLLRTWATGGIAADEAIFDIAMPLFESGTLSPLPQADRLPRLHAPVFKV